MRRFPPVRHSRKSLPPAPHSSPRAFTLVEVLLATSVLAILIAILAAGIGFARETAYQAKCANQLRTIATTMKVYANDNNQKFLLWGSGEYVTWFGALKNYGLSLDDCRCPSLPAKNKVSRYVTFGRRSQADIDKSLMLQGYPDSGNWLYLLRVQDPARYPFWADAVFPLTAGSGVRAGDQSYSFRLNATKAAEPGVHLRHNGKANVAFLDGHVETLTLQGLREIGISSGYDKNIAPVP